MLMTPLPLSQTVTPSQTPSPLERDVLYGRPLNDRKTINQFRPTFVFDILAYFCYELSCKIRLFRRVINDSTRIIIITNETKSKLGLSEPCTIEQAKNKLHILHIKRIYANYTKALYILSK